MIPVEIMTLNIGTDFGASLVGKNMGLVALVPGWQQRFIAQWACTYGTWAFQQHTKTIECTTPKNSSSRRRVSGIAFRRCGLMMKSLLLKRAALVSGRVGHGRTVRHCDCRSSKAPLLLLSPGTEADVVWLLFLDRSAPSCCVTGGTELCAECRESVRDKDGNALPFGPVFHLVDTPFFCSPLPPRRNRSDCNYGSLGSDDRPESPARRAGEPEEPVRRPCGRRNLWYCLCSQRRSVESTAQR
jgi:hypothetical protein